MRLTIGLLLGVLTLGVGAHQVATSADAKADGFIGAGLDGWDGLKQYWKYDDGVLIGSTPEGLKFNTFLCSKKKYGDFELKFQVRLKGGKGNSGVQIRSKIHEPLKANFQAEGPQCDIGDQFWGSLYGEHFGGMMKAADSKLVAKVLKKDDFNDYYIKAVGKHVTIKINGETTVDGDFPKMPADGFIAFQLHSGGPMEVTYKNIEFKEVK